jgi:hypothetical protein
MIWRIALALLPELQSLGRAILGSIFGLLFLLVPLVGLHAQPWAPWWFANPSVPAVTVPVGDAGYTPASPQSGDVLGGGRVTDAQRYQLARGVGFSQELAILMTALSIAENGSGNPSALSAVNRNGTRDLGLWQINTIWWAQFGGPEALTDPWKNAQAAHYIYNRQGPCAWSTYEASCGPGHNSSYRAFLSRARQAAEVQAPGNQA